MTDAEKLDQDIAAATAGLERAAAAAPDDAVTASTLHMLRLALSDAKARRDQPRRRSRAA